MISKAPMPKMPPEAKPAPEEPSRAKSLLRLLARRIRSLRQRQGLTQEDFAAKCGISVSFASLLERGERSPSYETLVRVSEALQLPLAELFRNAVGPTYDDPYYSRLLEFARQRRLSRPQVDRLIAVGQVVFDGQPEPSLRAGNRPAQKVSHCSVQGCSRLVLAKGLCSSHYHRARRAKL